MADDSLEINFEEYINQEDIDFLNEYIPFDTIRNVFEKIKSVIADMALDRVQSKIAVTFNHGFGNGALLQSVYKSVDGNTITVSSTKPYFAILNRGFRGFDMKEAFAGKRIKMRIPGGGIIYRTCGDENPDPRKKTKVSRATWYHPGYTGVHIYERAEQELKISIKSYVDTEISKLMGTAKNNAGLYNESGGKKRYNVRSKGRFAKVAPDYVHEQYQSPLIYRNGKYLVPGDEGYDLEERAGYEGYHTADDYDYETSQGYHVGKSVLRTNGAPQYDEEEDEY